LRIVLINRLLLSSKSKSIGLLCMYSLITFFTYVHPSHLSWPGDCTRGTPDTRYPTVGSHTNPQAGHMPHHSVIIWAGMKSIKPLPPFLPVKDSSYYILGHDAGRDFSGGNTRASMEQTDQRVRVQVKRARPISSVLRRSARLSLGCTCATLQPLSPD
jgi:hypothetical protein